MFYTLFYSWSYNNNVHFECIIVIWHWLPMRRMTVEVAKSKSEDFKRQQCSSKWTLLLLLLLMLISYNYKNVNLYTICNREKIKTSNIFIFSSPCNAFTVMSSCYWQSEKEGAVMFFRAKRSLMFWRQSENDISLRWIFK